ncbi:DUF2272 domain-containing protein [Flavobacterium sp.]|uniref:DUF2272 domain-containing protein n=1 Tax=Flavobacterium sp. TaxID=239 RepID=UPI00286EB147|nr:DUF2272 domain-containing protein [Flavobacterium sp.]
MENYIINYRRNRPNNNLYESLNYFNQNEQVVAPRPANTKDWCAIRNQIAYILGQAELDWIDAQTGRQLLEGDRNPDRTFRMLDYLEEYWKGVRGITTNPPEYQNVNPISTALHSAQSHPTIGIWSAAFVSWAMRTAGVEESDGFVFSMRHITYVVQALSNARKNDTSRPVWLVDNTNAVEVGDILCFNRKNGNGVMSNHTLNGLARLYLDANNNIRNLEDVRGVSHCDVVKEIVTENNRKFAIVVGGNKGAGTVTSVRIRLNNNNTILNPATVRNPGSCFGIIKLGSGCAPRTTESITEGEDESLHQPFFTNAFLFRRNANNPNTLNVIFEGDSWLDYPIPRVLDLYDTISDRNQSLNLNSLHLAKFGETTSDMFNDKANFVQYISNYRIDRIYFSGGGNDVFPQLGAILNPGITSFSTSFFTDQSKLNDLRNTASGDELFRKCILYKRYLNTSAFESALFNTTNLNRIFNTIATNYLGFGSIVNSNSTPNTKFYMHTYDYPLYKLGVRPSLVNVSLPLGPWIKPVFDRLHINDEILRCYIIIRLLDKFHYLLNCIKAIFIQRRYQFQTQIIDFRGLLNGSQYWRDEIHPNSAGASRLSTRVNF